MLPLNENLIGLPLKCTVTLNIKICMVGLRTAPSIKYMGLRTAPLNNKFHLRYVSRLKYNEVHSANNYSVR